jgi:hypothetical protein
VSRFMCMWRPLPSAAERSGPTDHTFESRYACANP